MTKGRLHVVALPHTEANSDFSADAYQQKHRKFCNMMMDIGYEVFSYAGEHSDMNASEHIVISSDADKLRWFGRFDHHKDFFPITWGPNEPHWVESNNSAIQAMRKRIRHGDVICLIAGACQQQIAIEFPNNPVVEYGIGYRGSFCDFRVFESYSHMHWVYGNVLNSDNGRHYDCVIPNYFEPEDFYISESKKDYHVFLGRFIPRKGVEIAVEATRKQGVQLIMAGQGCRQEGNVFSDDSGWSVSGEHITHIGHVNEQQRAKLLAEAQVCYMPTTYLEPFGGVSVESLLSGTPVIASDFGAFTEIVKHGWNGYRFRTIGEAARYASCPVEWNPQEIRDDAINRFGVENVALKYDDFFKQVIGAFYGKEDFYSDFHGLTNRYNYP